MRYLVFKIKEHDMTIKNCIFALLVLAPSIVNAMNNFDNAYAVANGLGASSPIFKPISTYDPERLMRQAIYKTSMNESCFGPLTADNFDLANTNRQDLFCTCPSIIEPQKSVLRIFVAAMHDVD